MKLNGIFASKKMMSYEEVKGAHDMLAAIVMGQTPIRFSKLKKGETNPLQMMAEVFAFILKLDHGRQVAAVIEDLRSKLELAAKQTAQQAEQDKIVKLIQKGYEPPEQSAIVPPNNSHPGAA